MKLVLRFLETRWKACCCAIVLMKLQKSNGKINPIFSDITNFGKPQCKLEAVLCVLFEYNIMQYYIAHFETALLLTSTSIAICNS